MRSIAILLLATIPLHANAKEPSASERDLMKQIALHCGETPILDASDPSLNSKIQDYNDILRWVERDMTALAQTMPDAETSEYVVNGKPFKAHVKTCIETVNKNNQTLGNMTSQQPNQAAVDKIDSALLSCMVIVKNSPAPDKPFSEFSHFYTEYVRNRDDAFTLDERARKWRLSEREKCDQQIAVLKSAYDKKQAAAAARAKKEEEARKARQAAAENERQRAIAEQREREQAALDEKLRKAQALGFKYYQPGLLQMIKRLNSGQLNIKEAKSTLVETDSSDTFKVQNIVDNYVVYAYTTDSFDVLQVALRKESGQYYGEGAEIPQGFYKIRGVEEFTSLLGGTRQIAVLGPVSE